MQFWFFYQWWQMIKRNAVLFTEKLRCRRKMMNEWLIMSGLKWSQAVVRKRNCVTSFMVEGLSYRKRSIDLLCKSMDWFLYARDLRHERFKLHAKLTELKAIKYIWYLQKAPSYIFLRGFEYTSGDYDGILNWKQLHLFANARPRLHACTH